MTADDADSSRTDRGPATPENSPDQTTPKNSPVPTTPENDPDGTTPENSPEGTTADGSRREVVVPERLYRIVTVFSTLIAVVGVILGFVLLDAATENATVPIEQVNPWLAALGILAILGGGATYAYAARFRAAGMRKDKDATDEPSNNG